MLYYWLDYASDDTIGEDFPQSERTLPCLGDAKAMAIASAIRNNDEVPGTIERIERFQMEPGSRLTDLVSTSLRRYGLLVSPKLQRLMTTRDIGNARIFETRLLHTKGQLDYYYIYFSEGLMSKIDYVKSTFAIVEDFPEMEMWGNWRLENAVRFRSENDFQFKVKEIAGIKSLMCVNLHLRLPVLPDVLYFKELNSRFLVSQDFVDDLLGAKISGIDPERLKVDFLVTHEK